MFAGTAKIDITPARSVWMDGMIRDRKSEGVHDPIYVRALVISGDGSMDNACAVVSAEVCGLKRMDTGQARASASSETGIPADTILVAATHTHSGPATIGFFNPREEEYLDELLYKISLAIQNAARSMRPAVAGCASGYESTISHYRRLCAEDGHVVMNWEPYPPGNIIGPLGEIDPEVGVVKIVDAENPENTIGVLFNHAGHPNVMSGDNYLISGDYPGLAMRLGCFFCFSSPLTRGIFPSTEYYVKNRQNCQQENSEEFVIEYSPPAGSADSFPW